MINVLIGIILGIGIATTFPNETAEFSEFLRGKINEGAQVVVENTNDESLVDKFK